MTPADGSAAAVSIRGRLSTAVLKVAFGWGLAASLAAWLAVRHEVREVLDDALISASGLIAAQVEIRPGELAPTPVASGSDRFIWQVVASDGHVMLHSTRAPARALIEPAYVGLATAPGGWRVHGSPLGGGRVLYVAQSRRERIEALGEVAAGTAAATLAVGVIATMTLRQRTRRELQPLQDFSEQVRQHDPLGERNDLGDPRPLPPVDREELRPMRDAIDGLGRRLAERVRHERAFAAHAAHALRTPLAGMDAQLAVALRECPPGAGGDAQRLRLQRMREATARLGRVVGALLTLFRSGAGDPARQPVDLAAVVAHMPMPGLQVEVAPRPADLPAPEADPDLLAAALVNLLDNAVRHGATRVTVRQPAGGAIELEDDGPGIAPEAMQALQHALDTDDHRQRTGLGLMLADRVARAHGGRLRLAAGDGGGLRVTLTLGREGRA